MKALSRLMVTLAGAAALAAASAIPSFAQANFYEGKQVRIIVAGSTGSNYDNFARFVARYIAKHIPGNPAITVSVMSGASGIIATNYLYNVAPKDGTVILAVHSSIALAQITGVANIEYDARNFAWVGRVASAGHDVQYVWASTNVTKFDDLLQREVVVGGSGPTSNSVLLPNTINQMMGGKLKVLRGYQGAADAALAVERGELQMAMMNWDLLRNQHAHWLRDKKVNVLVQFNLERHRELPNVPTIIDVSKTDEQKQVWGLLLRPVVIGYSYGVVPGVPADRLAILRKAFDDTMKDPEFLAEAQKVNLPIEPETGVNLAKVVDAMFQVDPKNVETVKSLMAAK
jgi:tripartite-type tricarboxylate transporter receptor subunit TctC